MAANITHFRIFLSGPSDVAPEINLVKSSLADINSVLSGLHISFDPFHWIENVMPGLSDDPQKRINEKSQGYDAIISIFGTRFGRPTKHYRSGTVEEIEIAIKKSDISKFGADSVMVFFKRASIDSMYADLDDIAKLREYRDSLSKRGVLYKEYKSNKDLKKFVYLSVGGLLKKAIDEGLISTNKQSVERILNIDHISHSKDDIEILDELEFSLPKTLKAAIDYSKNMSLQMANIRDAIQRENSAMSNFTESIKELRSNNIFPDLNTIILEMDRLSESTITNALVIDKSSRILSNEWTKLCYMWDLVIDLYIRGKIHEKEMRNIRESIAIMKDASDQGVDLANISSQIAENLAEIPDLSENFNKSRLKMSGAIQQLSATMMLSVAQGKQTYIRSLYQRDER